VGIGYHGAGHVTAETLSLIQNADRLFFLVYDPLQEDWLRSMNRNTLCLRNIFKKGVPLIDACNEVAEQILHAVRAKLNVCAAFSGHPGIAVYPAHEALRRATAEGYRTKMFPAISALDCLFADLGVDPARGCQLFEAEALLERTYRVETRSCLVVLQPGVIGIRRHRSKRAVSLSGIRRLTEALQKYYSPHHQVVIYEAAMVPVFAPRVETVPLNRLPTVKLTALSTLYIPPIAAIGRLGHRHPMKNPKGRS
jgi:uncharacterized protein YabN with tetrapyrrole methylase and pyrophosphatase domain